MVNQRAGILERIRVAQWLIVLATLLLAGTSVRADAPASPANDSPAATVETSASDADASEALKDDPRYQRWRVSITWGLVILIAFVTAAGAIVTFSRGFRRWLGKSPTPPTASEDVWAMHKTPDAPPDPDEDDNPEQS